MVRLIFSLQLKKILTSDRHSVESGGSNSKPHVITKSASDEILALFERSKGWDGRHRQIMLLSKQLDPMPDENKNDNSLIKGCESLAWLTCSKDPHGYFSFQAYSDAKVIRGLMVIILAAVNLKNSQQIAEFDLESYFEKMGLIKHLSPSRGNGVRAIIERIKLITQ